MFDIGSWVRTARAQLAAARQELGAVDLAALGRDELLDLMSVLETDMRQRAAVSHALVAEVEACWALTGERLPARYPQVAAAVADGAISDRHAAFLRSRPKPTSCLSSSPTLGGSGLRADPPHRQPRAPGPGRPPPRLLLPQL